MESTIEIIETPDGPEYIECFGDDYYGSSWPVDACADYSPSDGKFNLAREPNSSLARLS